MPGESISIHLNGTGPFGNTTFYHLICQCHVTHPSSLEPLENDNTELYNMEYVLIYFYVTRNIKINIIKFVDGHL